MKWEFKRGSKVINRYIVATERQLEVQSGYSSLKPMWHTQAWAFIFFKKILVLKEKINKVRQGKVRVLKYIRWKTEMKSIFDTSLYDCF